MFFYQRQSCHTAGSWLIGFGSSKMLLSSTSHTVRFQARPRFPVHPAYISSPRQPKLRRCQQLQRPLVQFVCRASVDVENAGEQPAATVPTDAAPQPADNILYVTRLGKNHTKEDLVTSLTELLKSFGGFHTINVVQSAESGNFTGYAVFDTAELANTARKELRNAKLNDKKIAVGTHKRIGRDTTDEADNSSTANSSKRSSSSSGSKSTKQQQEQQQRRQPRKANNQQARENTLYVKNLAWSSLSEDLQEHFKGCEGFADAFITHDKHGRPSGFGFVRFASKAAAAAAAEAMDQSELDGRTLSVELARPGRYESSSTDDAAAAADNATASAGSQKKASAAALAGATATETRVVVRQLPGGFTYREVFGMCSVFGNVRKVKLYDWGSKGSSTQTAAAEEPEQSEQDGMLLEGDAASADEGEESSGVQQQQKVTSAIAFMADRASAERVVAELDGREVQGSTLRVNLYRNSKRKEADA